MLYEVRTYDLKANSLAEVEKRFGEAYEKRKEISPLAAFWHTEIGPLNQIIHVWPYKDFAERAKIRAAVLEKKVWPPKISEFITWQKSEIMIPMPFSPEIKPGKLGPYFEMRTYTYANGELPKIIQAWEKVIPGRTQYSPLCAAWYSEFGGLNQFVHIWPYPTMEARNKTRQETQAAGVWPPSAVAKKDPSIPSYLLLKQENKIVMPSAFSPLQ
jgi:hypothetical protein